jgi:hypothetical protein
MDMMSIGIFLDQWVFNPRWRHIRTLGEMKVLGVGATVLVVVPQLSRIMYLVKDKVLAVEGSLRQWQPPLGDLLLSLASSIELPTTLKLLTGSAIFVLVGKSIYELFCPVPGLRPSMPRGLGFSSSVADLVEKTGGGVQVTADYWNFRLFGSPFPLQAQNQSAEILREAARYAGILQ